MSWLSFLSDSITAQLTLIGVSILAFSIKLVSDFREAGEARRRVLDAEEHAFRTLPKQMAERASQTPADGGGAAGEDSSRVLRAQRSIRMGYLFDVYNKQIEKYQTETQARAGWSFIFAIFSMLAGLAVVIGGGTYVLSGANYQARTAGVVMAGIGAALSGFITRTFLDVHKLSLGQLNRYFRQPVLNSHILTAQRLAEQIEDPAARQELIKMIIAAALLLVHESDEARDPVAKSRLAATISTALSRPAANRLRRR